MDESSGKRERRKHPRFYTDLRPEYRTADDGVESLDRKEDNNFDGFVTDAGMPKLGKDKQCKREGRLA